jgi:hypothetical protein
LDRFHRGSVRLIPCALVMAGLISGCDKMALLAPSGTAITFQFPAGTGTGAAATGPSVALNSTISITATVIEQGGTSTGTGAAATSTSAGTPVQNGTAVSFTTTLGTIQPSTATTVNGQVTVQFVTGSTSGTAGITAFSGAAHASLNVTVGNTGAVPRTTLLLAAPATAPAVSTPATFTVTPTAATGAYITDATINFGDGGTLDLGPISAATSVAHLYAKAGTFTVSASATDSTNATAAAVATIVVAPLSSTVSASPTNVTLASGLSILFTVANSPTGASIDHYEWDFGDGSTTSSTGSTQNHAYGITGTFTVTVRVVPMAGASFTITTQCKVT